MNVEGRVDKMTVEKTKQPNQVAERRTYGPKAPNISLQQGVEHVRKLYEKDGRSGSRRESAVKHLGYTGLNGASMTLLADLKKMKLTTDQDKRIMLTRDALLILVSQDEGEKKEALRRCALAPTLYDKVYKKYADSGHLPSQETLESDLILEHGFDRAKVKQVADALRDTFQFAGVFDGNSRTDQVNFQPSNELDFGGMNTHTMLDTPRKEQPSETQRGQMRDYAIPRRAGKLAVLRLEFPVTAKDIEHITKWLALMKETISDESNETGDSRSSDSD
jgi:hypothetical protein